MKIKAIFFILLTSTLFIRCIQDEPLNQEADILEITLPGGIATSEPQERRGANDITNISITVKPLTDITHIAPQIIVTEGATITPDPATPQDFTTPVTYTVTAQDKTHRRVYSIALVNNILLNYNFEIWETNSFSHYQMPAESDEEGNLQHPWSSSNVGVALYIQYPTPGEYPVHATTTAIEGEYAAEMVTQKGPGNILEQQYIPIIAGSLFTGNMRILNALKDPLTATRFGNPFNHKPQTFNGYYKYTPGTGDYIGPDGQPRAGVKDSCGVYSVFYKADGDFTLDGNNVLTHPNIVAIAMMTPEMRASSPGNDFVYFSIPFVYKEGVTVDLKKNTYKLAIILASSYYGDHYEGTVGSRLIVDNVQITIEEDK